MKKAIVMMAILVSMIGLATASTDVRTSNIVGGNSFVEGTQIEIGYAVETTIAGEVEFRIDGQTVSRDDVAVDGGSTENTYVYRTSSLDVGKHSYEAVFTTTNGETHSSDIKEIRIVEAENAPEGEQPQQPIIQQPDPPVEFGDDFQRTFRPSYGFTQEKTFPVTNNRDTEMFVNMDVPATANGCQFIRLQESNGRNAGFAKSATYEIPPESTGVRKVETTKNFQIQFNIPEKEKWEEQGLDTVNCEIQVETSEGEASNMVVEVQPTNSVFASVTGDLTKNLASGGSVSVAGTQVSLVPILAFLLIGAIIVGALYTRLEPSLDKIGG